MVLLVKNSQKAEDYCEQDIPGKEGVKDWPCFLSFEGSKRFNNWVEKCVFVSIE